MAQRMRFLLHQKVPPFGVVRRVRCPFSYGHRDSCRRASSLAKTSAPRSLGRLVDPAHSPVTGPAALADGDCRLAVVLALDRLRGGLGLAARTPSLGSCLWRVCGPLLASLTPTRQRSLLALLKSAPSVY